MLHHHLTKNCIQIEEIDKKLKPKNFALVTFLPEHCFPNNYQDYNAEILNMVYLYYACYYRHRPHCWRYEGGSSNEVTLASPVVFNASTLQGDSQTRFCQIYGCLDDGWNPIFRTQFMSACYETDYTLGRGTSLITLINY